MKMNCFLFNIVFKATLIKTTQNPRLLVHYSVFFTHFFRLPILLHKLTVTIYGIAKIKKLI